MPDQTKPRTWRTGDPEPGLDVQAVQHTNSQVFLRRPWPVRYGPRNATTVWQAGPSGRPLSWERLTERLNGYTLTEYSLPVSAPAEPEIVSERPDETPETMVAGELHALARTHASEQPICGQGHPNPRLDHVRCTQATGHTSSHRAFADPNCTCYTWNASERPDPRQEPHMHRSWEVVATRQKARADAAEAKLDEIRAVADMPAEKLVAHWTNWTELAERADAERSRRIRTIVGPESTR